MKKLHATELGKSGAKIPLMVGGTPVRVKNVRPKESWGSLAPIGLRLYYIKQNMLAALNQNSIPPALQQAFSLGTAAGILRNMADIGKVPELHEHYESAYSVIHQRILQHLQKNVHALQMKALTSSQTTSDGASVGELHVALLKAIKTDIYPPHLENAMECAVVLDSMKEIERQDNPKIFAQWNEVTQGKRADIDHRELKDLAKSRLQYVGEYSPDRLKLQAELVKEYLGRKKWADSKTVDSTKTRDKPRKR